MAVTSSKRHWQLGWFDYFLSEQPPAWLDSAGFGLGVPEVAFFYVGWTLAATILGAVIQKMVPRKFLAADGVFYALCAIMAVTYGKELNRFLPGEGFPDQLRVAGWLCWMLVFGSLFMWRDSTVLFQAVPGIAIFGLVGTWDTFRASPFLFFAFLLCFATLFARAHARGMMVRAQDSGFTSNALDANRPGGFLAALRRGPWKWMAGPEWALLSALVVVLISLIGAPFLQFSLKGVAGKITLPPPPSPAMRQNYFGSPIQSASTNFQTGPRVSVGTGPHGDLAKTKIFRVQFFQSAYMLAHTCMRYNGKNWDLVDTMAISALAAKTLFTVSTQSTDPGSVKDFSVQYLAGSFDSIPVPGTLRSIDGIEQADCRLDGTVANPPEAFAPGNHGAFNGQVTFPESAPVSVNATSPILMPYAELDDHISTQRVRDFAQQAVRGAKTDYEKAEAIRRAVAATCTYDLNAPAVPDGQDAVDYFLFESHRGYCDLFASAMTIMARAVNLPARFVIGWAPFTNPQKDEEGWVTYYETDYHCWSQIFFRNVGWVNFDATDGAAEAPGAGRGSTRSTPPWYLKWSVGFGLSALGAIGLVALILSIGNKLRWRLPFLGQRRSEVERNYADLVRMMETRTGKPKRPSQTPFEYLEAVMPFLDGSYAAVKSATDAFVAAYYGSAEPQAENINAFKESARLAKEALKNVKRPKD